VKRASIVLTACAVLLSAACGGGNDSSTGPNNNGATAGDGNIRATFNGTAWRSLKSGDRVSKSGQFYGISSVNPPYAIVISIANVTAPGTFQLNLQAGGNGSSGIVSNSTGGWGTAFAGGTGTVTVTTLTANRIAGTFSFDAVPASGSASGTMQVRNGTFDLTF
jgi:hypothetical protein